MPGGDGKPLRSESFGDKAAIWDLNSPIVRKDFLRAIPSLKCYLLNVIDVSQAIGDAGL